MQKERVEPIRREEERFLKEIAWWNALLSLIMMAFPRLLVCATLLLYVEVNGSITPVRRLLKDPCC